MSAEELLAQDFGTLADVIREQARERPQHPALVQGERRLTYGELDALMDRIAAALQRDGVANGDAVAACATTSLEYAATFFGILRAGGVVAPLAPSSTPESLAMMLKDSGATIFFLDKGVADALAPVAGQITAKRVAFDVSDAGVAFQAWLAPAGATPQPVAVTPDQGFNIIYSSGTTGAPKGIVQPHSMRWGHVRRGIYTQDAVTAISTPLYSNTTLVSFLPTVTNGGTAVLMPKFDAAEFLKLASKHRATHAMLVPVQYRRLLAYPGFDGFDLSSFRLKLSTSAPFAGTLKAEVLRRWPGDLVEYYGMTEGGGSCLLDARRHPAKLDTVGQPMEGHEIRLIDEEGREVPPGGVGEVVGRSPAMMIGYFNRPEATAAAEWFDAEGRRFIRTGDVGRFDADGFLVLADRKKDMIISGGFNIYPSDLEAVLVRHEAVAEAAVVGVASERWGETPVAFVVLRSPDSATADEVRAYANERLGKTQRLAAVRLVADLPRSPIGKVLKRELRASFTP